MKIRSEWFVRQQMARQQISEQTQSVARPEARLGARPEGSGKGSGIVQLRSYGVAIATVALALGLMQGLRLWLYPTITPLFLMAVMLSAWYGGLRAGLLATFLSMLAINYYFVEPFYSFSILDVGTVMRLLSFLLAAGLISSLNHSRRIALKRSQEALRSLQLAVSHEQAASAEATTVKERLETVLSSINDGFYVLDCDWRLSYVNDRYCEIVQKRPSELLGQNIWQLFPDAVNTEAYEQFHRAMREQTPLEFDYFYEPWQGWYDHRIYPSPAGLTVLIADITARKQAEAALQKSEERLGLAINSAGMATWDMNMQTGQGVWSTSHFEMLGYAPVLSGKATYDMWHSRIFPADVEAAMQAMAQAQQSRTLYNVEYRIIRVDTGEVRWLKAFGRFVEDATRHSAHHSGQHSGQYSERFVGVLFDITESKRVELALQKSENQLRLASEGGNFGLWYWDLVTDTLSWSDRAKALFGLPLNTKMSMQVFREAVHPNDRPLLDSVITQLQASQVQTEMEYRTQWPDGTIRWILARGDCDYSADGVMVATRGVLIDITEHKQAEHALQLSQERLQIAVSAANLGMWFWDIESDTLIWTERCKALFGLPLDDSAITYTDFIEVLHPDDRQRTHDAVSRAMAERVPYDIEYRAVWPDGSVHWIAAKGACIYNAAGSAIRMNGVVIDIGDRKQSEAEREQLLQREQLLRHRSESSEAKLQQVLASIREDFVLFDHQWNIAYINAQAADTMGVERSEVLGRNMWALFPDLVDTEFYNQLYRVMRDRTPTQFEYYYSTWDVWFENRAYPTPEGVVILSTNITGRKREELNNAFLSELDVRLRQLSTAEAMLEEVTSSVGAYLSVDRCLWDRVDWAADFSIVEQDWRQQEVPSMVGTYRISEFVLPDLVSLYQQGQPAIVPDITTYVYTTDFADNIIATLGLRAFLAVPCVYEGRWVATLSVNSTTVRTWRADEVTLLQELVAHVWPLTEQTRATQSLRQSEAEFRLLANAMPQIVYVSNADGRLEFVNDRWIEYTGMDLEQTLNLDSGAGLMPAEDQAKIKASFLRAQQTRSPYREEFRLIQPDGSYLHFLTRAVPILDAEGQVYKWYGTSTDVTEFKQLEADLRQKNAILNAINESSPAPIFVKDRAGRIIFANPATLEMLGKSESEVIGFRNCDLYPSQEDAALIMENDRRIMESGEMEIIEESPDGVRTFLGMKVPYRNEAGEVIGLIGISNDISDRVQFERDRERILQREQAARETAERANRIKDEFLAVVSHELRTPLNPILGWAQLLQRGQLDASKTEKALATIERNAQLQSQLIDDLLDISRILRGKLSLNMVAVDLRTVISAALETVHLAAEAKSIRIHAQFAPEVGAVTGDSGRLQQVVWNLLSNAVKFTPAHGQITVTLDQIRDSTGDSTGDSSDGSAHIQVSDTGKGIAPDFLPYVFEHFRQEDGAITRQFGGLGLGLAIVKQIVELHGGTISAESAGEGQGATFSVQIPLAPAASNLPSMPSSMPLIGDSSRPVRDLTDLRILVVDDERDSREFIEFVLQQTGAKVTSVTRASEALQAIEQSVPDLIVSDIGMPDMDGYSLMKQVRARLPASRIPAVALTAYAGEFDRAAAIAAGFQQHIPKPVDPQRLVSTIHTLIKVVCEENIG
jgi:PAS domain S-box-containing protein